jgi:two-component system nitrogen regulation response regulator GlnG
MAAAEGLPRRQLTAAGAALLARQAWRGNVRELRNLIYRLALMARDDTIDAATIEPMLGSDTAAPQRPVDDEGPQDLAGALDRWLTDHAPGPGQVYNAALAAFERPLFLHVLGRTAGNQLRAAQILGINRNTLRKRLSDLGIHPDDHAVRG